MPFNGSGTYTLPAGNPVTTGTTISSTTTNSTNSDIATALSNCVTRDGQSPATANLPLGGFKVTNLAAGSSNGDSVRYEQLTAVVDSVQYVANVASAGSNGQVLTSAGTGAPTWTNQDALSVGTATTSTNLAGGAAGKLPFQTGSGTTSFTAVGTSGQVLTSAGTGTPTWETLTTFKLLATITPTAAANCDFLSTFTSAYDNYLILFDNIAPSSYTSTPGLQMLFANAGTVDTNSNYIVGNTSSETTTTTTQMTLYQQNIGYGSGAITIFNVNDPTNMKWVNSQVLTNVNSTVGIMARNNYFGYIKSASVSGVRFNWSNGSNFSATGKIRIYGYANS
jgi:hypothetical protein